MIDRPSIDLVVLGRSTTVFTLSFANYLGLIFIAFHDGHAVTSYQKSDEVHVLAKTLG